MQPNKLLVSAALTLSCFLPIAQAEDWYAEGFVSGTKATIPSGFAFDREVYLGTAGLRGGYQFTDNFSIEGEVQTSIDSDTVIYAVEKTKVGLHSSAGVFGKYAVPVNERFDLHARLGFASLEYEYKTGGEKDFIDTYEGLAFGLGGTLNLTDTLYLRGDATRYDSSDAETDSFSIGAGLRF